MKSREARSKSFQMTFIWSYSNRHTRLDMWDVTGDVKSWPLDQHLRWPLLSPGSTCKGSWKQNGSATQNVSILVVTHILGETFQDPKTNDIHDFTMDFLIFYPGVLQSKHQSYRPRNGLKTAPPEKETRLRCRCFSAKGYDLNMWHPKWATKKNKKPGLTFHHTACEKKGSL